jgi:hypothetical protein
VFTGIEPTLAQVKIHSLGPNKKHAPYPSAYIHSLFKTQATRALSYFNIFIALHESQRVHHQRKLNALKNRNHIQSNSCSPKTLLE